MKMGIERVLKEKFGDALKDIQQVYDEENRETTVEVSFRFRHFETCLSVLLDIGGELVLIVCQT